MSTVQTPVMEVSIAQLGEGTPLVYLHDVLFDLVTAEGVAPELLETLARSHSVIAPAFPCFRDLRQLSAFSSVGDYVLLVRDVIGRLGLERPHVVGTGLGGWIAAELAALYPDDVGTLTLVNSFGLRVDDHPTARFFDAAAPNALGGRREIRELLYVSPDEAPAIDLLPDFPDDAANEQYFTHVHAAARIGWAPPAFYDPRLLGRLDRITAPTHVVWASGNKVVDVAHGRAFEANIDGAVLTVIDGAGQAISVEQPKELASAISGFLEGHDAKSRTATALGS
jgi:pimeloyl-ACP methyl ester carboxylesterase